MSHIETFSTAELPVSRRLQYWNDLACSTFTPIVADPVDVQTYAPHMTRTTIDGIRVGLVRSDPSVVHHAREHVSRTMEPLFFLQMQLRGSSLNRQGGREALIHAGDFTLFDNTRPYQMDFEETNDILVLGIPAKMMRTYIAHPEDLVAIPMPYSVSCNQLLSDSVRRLWSEFGSMIASSEESRIARVVLELTASAYAALPSGGGERPMSAPARRVRVLNYIEQHLTEASLTPGSIARNMGVTPRYLHMLFAGDDETLARHILRRRLEEAARLLEQKQGREQRLGTIAFSCGFASLTHFGKAFRAKYGMTPRSYRNRCREAEQG